MVGGIGMQRSSWGIVVSTLSCCQGEGGWDGCPCRQACVTGCRGFLSDSICFSCKVRVKII